MNIKIVIDDAKVLAKVKNPEIGLFTSHEWKRLLNPYTPRNTGMLEQNVTYGPYWIRYNQEYAVYVYYGDRMNFQKKNPLACAHWDRAAAAAGQAQLLADSISKKIRSMS